MKSLILLPLGLALTLTTATLTGCEGSQVGKPAPDKDLVQTCDHPPGVTLTTFKADGALKWMPEMKDGGVGIRYCDSGGDGTYRIVEVTGLRPGLTKNRQDGWATDLANQVVFIDDLDILSTTPVEAPRLFDVMIQCVELPGATCDRPELQSPTGT